MYRKDSVISLSTSNRTTPNIVQNPSSDYKSGLASGSTSRLQASHKATSSRFSRHSQAKQVAEGTAESAVADAAESKKGGILSDFSFVQVFSSALAAITSTLLSAHIGIIGGIVAVGVGAAVSAMASQVYKALLEASHQKLKEVAQDQTTLMPSSSAQVSRAVQESQGAYQQHGTQGVTQRIAKVEGAQSANVRIAPGYLRSRAQQERRRKIVAAVLIAAITLAAVGATAAVINLATKGDGLGTKTNFGTVLTQQSPTTTGTSTSPTGTTSKNPTATTNDTSTNTQSTSSGESSAQSNGEQESQDSSQGNSSSEDGTSTSGDSSSEDTSGTSNSGSSDGTTSGSDQNSQQGSSDKTDSASGTTEGTSSSNSNSGQTTTTKTS